MGDQAPNVKTPIEQTQNPQFVPYSYAPQAPTNYSYIPYVPQVPVTQVPVETYQPVQYVH